MAEPELRENKEMKYMIRGITFQLNDEGSRVLQDILANIDIKSYKWNVTETDIQKQIDGDWSDKNEDLFECKR